MKKECPICQSEYREGEKICQNCRWDLSLYDQSSSGNVANQETDVVGSVFNEKVPKSLEKWAIRKWREINSYRDKINELRNELKKQEDSTIETSRPDIISQLIKRVTELEKQSQTSLQLESRVYDLEKTFSNLDETVTDKVQDSLNDLAIEERLIYLQNSLSKMLPTQTSSYQPQQQTSLPNKINREEQYLIDKYLQNPQLLCKQHANKVTLTKQTQEDIYLNKAVEIVFKMSNQNEYWIIQVSSGAYYLLPDSDLRINTNLKLIRMIFDFKDYSGNEQKKFTLAKCAKVSLINNNQWKLTEKGILQF